MSKKIAVTSYDDKPVPKVVETTSTTIKTIGGVNITLSANLAHLDEKLL